MNSKTSKKVYPPKIAAYLRQLHSGKAICDKARIIDFLSKGPATLDIFILQGFKIQTISARLSELEDEGIVYKAMGANKDFSWFHLIDDELQQDIAKRNKANEKKQAWINRGINMGYITMDQASTMQ